jgi:hypothetical protein
LIIENSLNLLWIYFLLHQKKDCHYHDFKNFRDVEFFVEFEPFFLAKDLLEIIHHPLQKLYFLTFYLFIFCLAVDLDYHYLHSFKAS